MNTNNSKYYFLLSEDISLPLKIKICNLEGLSNNELASFNGENSFKELYVSCELLCKGIPLSPVSTTNFEPFSSAIAWNKWINFQVKYRDLPLDSHLYITVWDIHGPGTQLVIGHAKLSLFSQKTRKIKQGRIKVKLFPITEPASVSNSNQRAGSAGRDIDRLEKLVKKYESKKVPHVPWLDKKTFEEFDKTKTKYLQESNEEIFLFLELPQFEHSVIFNNLIPSNNEKNVVKDIVIINDFEQSPSPVEMKHLKLARRSSIYDKDLKPDQAERYLIDKIISYAPHKELSATEKELIWKFRYYLSKNPKALPKFLRCIDWRDSINESQGVDLMKQWEPIDPADALELLSKEFKNIHVRKYAVSRLDAAGDDEILSYLLQLVQAMGSERATGNTPLTDFLIKRASENFKMGNFFYWYVTVEIGRGSGARNKLFRKKLSRFYLCCQESKQLKRGEELIHQLSKIQQEIRGLTSQRPRKIEILQEWLGPKGNYSNLYQMPSLSLPLNPSVNVTGVIPDKATIFKSAMAPLGIRFRTEDESQYMILFKSGDDLRQDQFIVQLITLMDRLLKLENLDLQLTPYSVLATSDKEGILECVFPSQSIASVLKNKDHDGNIYKYLRSLGGNFDENLENFVKSCAGYCVITYILGIGDRHLDNLLITPKGNLFHIDFGFILGKDPKPFPPPMKLCKEMVEGMGGASSEHYLKFKEHCCEAYNILRKSANLILNLFQLMIDSEIPDISDEPEKTILKVHEKFRLDLNDEDAGKFFQALITESVSALFPQITETIHRWAQYWRA